VESIFPVGEIVANVGLTMTFNVASVIYMLLGVSIHPSTMNWLLAGSCGAGGFALLFFNEQRRRTEVDKSCGIVVAGHCSRGGSARTSRASLRLSHSSVENVDLPG